MSRTWIVDALGDPAAFDRLATGMAGTANHRNAYVATGMGAQLAAYMFRTGHGG